MSANDCHFGKNQDQDAPLFFDEHGCTNQPGSYVYKLLVLTTLITVATWSVMTFFGTYVRVAVPHELFLFNPPHVPRWHNGL